MESSDSNNPTQQIPGQPGDEEHVAFPVKRFAILGIGIVVIVAAWLVLRSDVFQEVEDKVAERVSGEEELQFGLLRDEFDPEIDYSFAVGSHIPPFRLRGTDESVIDIREFEGQNVVLVFETTFCAFCVQEVPDLNRIAKGDKVKVVAIDNKEKEKTVQVHLEDTGITHPWYLDETGDVSLYFSLAGTPTHVYVNEEGIIHSRDAGYRTGEQLDAAIDDLINS